MSRRARRHFTEEYKAEAVELVRTSGKSLPRLAKDLDLTESVLRTWVEKAGRAPEAASAPLSAPERQELETLRKEVRVLRMERDLLKKATAFFAKETP